MTQPATKTTVPERTPELESLSIYEALGLIGNQEHPLLLPAIQRHFVWGMDQICALFDSILQGYPVGTFLFWEIEDQHRRDYAFYEFMRDYCAHEEKRYNPPATRSLPPGVIGVLDGQQRLNSLYVALCGSYSAYIGGQGNHKRKLESYPSRRLFVNLAYQPGDDDDSLYQFEFLTEWEQQQEHWKQSECWFPVHRIYHCADAYGVLGVWDEFRVETKVCGTFTEEQSAAALAILNLLRVRIREDKLIRYFPIRHRNITEALKIFIRANNGGSRVTEAEMIFATIVANWPDGRQKIEEFTRHLNQTGHGFGFDVSRIMLACLALAGCPIRLRVQSFTPAHVDDIRAEWETITRLMKAAAGLIDRWGLSGNNAVNSNVVIALALLLQSGIDAPLSIETLRQFVLHTLICDLYRRPEGMLRQVHSYAKEQLNPGGRFVLEHFEEYYARHSGKKIAVSAELLEELLVLPIWDKRTYVLLSLLHPQHALHQQEFHKDHIHPNSRFTDLENKGVSADRVWFWMDCKDRLPNLQLLQGQVNNVKRAKPFNDWIGQYLPAPSDRDLFLSQNDIPTDCSLDFADFEIFFHRRKDKLRSRLKTLLHVPDIVIHPMSDENISPDDLV